MDRLTEDERRLLRVYRRLAPTWQATIRTAAEQASGLQAPGPARRPRPALRLVRRTDGRQP